MFETEDSNIDDVDFSNTRKRKRVNRPSSLRRTAAGEADPPRADEPVPEVGGRSEKPEDIVRALGNWAEIFNCSDMTRLVKTLRANTAEAVELECENRTIPRRIMKARFPYLRPRFLGEECFTDTIDYKAKGRLHYLQIFYTRCSRTCRVYNVPGLKAGQLVGAYEKFARDVGVPTVWISDNYQAENRSEAVKKLAGKYHVRLTTTEAWQQRQNTVERMISTLKDRVEHIRSIRRIPSEYLGYLYKFVAHIHNLMANRNLNDRTPHEAYTGETGDLSHLRFAFYDPVWYSPAGSGDSGRMCRGRYLGPAESTGDEITHHILPVVIHNGKEVPAGTIECGKGKNKVRQPEVIQRSYVCARDVKETAFREILKDTRRSFLFPKHLFPSRTRRNGTPWNVMVTLARGLEEPLDEELVERGHKRRKVTNENGEIALEEPRPTVQRVFTPDYDMRVEPDKQDLHTLAKEHYNTLVSGQLAQSIDQTDDWEITGHRFRDGELLLKCKLKKTGEVHTSIAFVDCRKDMPDSLAKYIKDNGVGKRNNHAVWQWAVGFNKLRRSVLRRLQLAQLNWDGDLVGRTGLIIRRSRTKGGCRKSSIRKKFGIQIPESVEEAYALDKKNGNTYWHDSIQREIDSIMEKKTLYFPSSKAEQALLLEQIANNPKFQFAPMWIVFDVKPISLKAKARLVIGGHVVNSDDVETFSTMMSTEGSRVLMTIADLNGYDVAVGDINTAYLYAGTQEMIWTRSIEAFTRTGHASKTGMVGRVVKAQYGLPGSGHAWWLKLSETLRDLGFTRSRGDSDIWYRLNSEGTGYDYIGTHTDDIKVVAKDPQSIFRGLEMFYSFKETGAPTYHLGVDYHKRTDASGRTRYQLGSSTYVKEALRKIQDMADELGRKLPHVQKTPMKEKWKPELDQSPFCDAGEHRYYMQLIGIFLWIVRLGRVDIAFAVSSLSRFSALPRQNHLQELERVYGYLLRHPDRRLDVDSRPLEKIPGTLMGRHRETMQVLYPDAEEEIDPAFPEPKGRPVQTLIYFDSNHGHDEVTRRSIEGVMVYVGRTLVKAKTTRQSSIAAATYGAELHAGRTASEEAMGIRYLLRSLGVRVESATLLLGDNESSLKSTTIPKSPLNQRHLGISYHTARETEAAGITVRYYTNTKENLADGLTKALGAAEFNAFYKADGPVFGKTYD